MSLAVRESFDLDLKLRVEVDLIPTVCWPGPVETGFAAAQKKQQSDF